MPSFCEHLPDALHRGEQRSLQFIQLPQALEESLIEYNLPHIRGRAKGAPWDVLRGIMLGFFVTDGLGAALKFVAAIMAVVQWRRDKGPRGTASTRCTAASIYEAT